MLQNLAQANCTRNGVPVECGEVAGIFAAIFIPIILFGLIGFIFWIISLIHVLKHDDVKDRTIWILVILLVGGLGGIIYFFAVKRPYDKQKKSMPPAGPNQSPPTMQQGPPQDQSSISNNMPAENQQPTQSPQDNDSQPQPPSQQQPPAAPPTA